MSAQNLRITVKNAATASLFAPVSVRGSNTYIFASNLLSWDEANNYTIERIAADFGQPVTAAGTGTVGFRCGDSAVTAYDFGLIFSCMAAIVAAHTETGTTIFTASNDTSIPEIDVVWFGNNAIVYSKDKNLIVPLKSADVQNASRFQRVTLENFVDIRKFTLSRERFSFVLDNEHGEAVCRFAVPVHVQRSFPRLFDDDPTNDEIADDPNTPWDERSALGFLIASSTNLTSAEETAERYKGRVSLESVVVRSDLVMQPTLRYNSVQEFLGSLCYTDKDQIVLAVNFRDTLFVHKPWFDGSSSTGVQVTSAPKLSDFYNVTQECTYIEKYAKSVTAVPLNAAQFDIEVFEKVKTAFFGMELPRLNTSSIFGRIVIPESVLVKGVSSTSGETLFCIVPVGVIGTNLVCKAEDNSLYTINNAPWIADDVFYDITEVIK